MSSFLIESQIKSIEEELRIIKTKILKNKNNEKLYLNSLKDMFPQEVEFDDIKEAELKFKKNRLSKL